MVISITHIPQAEHELVITANSREVLEAANKTQTIQMRVVHAQLGRFRKCKQDELARTGLGHVFLLNVAPHDVEVYESTEPVEAAHFREALYVIAIENPLEGDDALTVLERQQEVVVRADVNWLEVGGAGEVELLEWKLDVCEC